MKEENKKKKKSERKYKIFNKLFLYFLKFILFNFFIL